MNLIPRKQLTLHCPSSELVFESPTLPITKYKFNGSPLPVPDRLLVPPTPVSVPSPRSQTPVPPKPSPPSGKSDGPAQTGVAIDATLREKILAAMENAEEEIDNFKDLGPDPVSVWVESNLEKESLSKPKNVIEWQRLRNLEKIMKRLEERNHFDKDRAGAFSPGSVFCRKVKVQFLQRSSTRRR